MAWLLVAICLVPVIAVVASLVSPGLPGRVATVACSVVALALAIVAAAHVRTGATLTGADGWLRVDALGAVFLICAAFLYAVGAVYSLGYLRADERRPEYLRFARRYFTYLNLFGLTMLLVPLMNDFATLWVAVELTTIVSVLLVALDRTDAALEAAWKYVLLASVGLGIALVGLIFLYAAGTPLLGDAYIPRYESYAGVAQSLAPTTVKLAFLLSVVGFGTKMGLAPMHTWLPDAHSEAPSPVSALLSGALLVGSFYAILRFFQVAVESAGPSFPRHVLLIFGAASLLVASLFVLRQENYKRMLAYSSIEHMGVMALGIGFGAPIAVAGALFHVLNHAAAKGLAFLGAGSILRRYDTKEIERVRGAATVLPWSGPMFLAAALALSGLPLSGIFRSEFQIVSGGLARSQYVWVAVLVVLVNLAFFGVVWAAVRMVMTPASSEVERGETSWWMVAAMFACLVVVVGLGLHVPSGLQQLLTTASHLLGASPT